jgi:ABC-2 type transport system ATP-binding protein
VSGTTINAGDVVLDARSVAKRYPGAARPALDGVSLQLHRGEVLGLLGPNGAGKTTLIEILTGFRSLDSGEVRVLGLDPTDRHQLRELRRRVGLVSQQVGHLRYLSVRETIELHHALHERPRGVDEVLDLVDLGDAADQRVRRLSGGQQRRLDVAVALVGRPELILLDEPTTGFDPGARRRAWDVVERLAHDGTSVLLTTHYMEEATRLADRVVVLGGGRVRGEGTPDELARELQLGTVIRARVPREVAAGDLPELVRGGLVEPGRFELQASEPTAALAQLCGWAVERGTPLEELDVRAPSLEETYLALTGAGAAEGDA